MYVSVIFVMIEQNKTKKEAKETNKYVFTGQFLYQQVIIMNKFVLLKKI